ncbi:MAG TPA: response regulator [Byssovorax sp.]|jgi:PAS domain S-box-containing protein
MRAVGAPWFGPEDAPALRDFWAVYEAHHDAVSAATHQMMEQHAEFRALLRGMTKQRSALEAEESRARMGRAIEGAWAEYEEHLGRQGSTFAQMGISFGSWFELARVLTREIVPHLVDAYAREPKRLAAAQLAWDDFIARTMMIIGTEYLRTKESILRASEARNAALLETALDPIVSIDAAGKILGWNPAAEQVFRCAREGAVGRPLADVIFPERLREERRARFARLAEGTDAMLGRRVELACARADGDEFLAEIALTADRAGRGANFTVYVRDLSNRSREQESIAIWSHVLEQGEFGLVVVDVDTDRVRFVNPRFATLYGYDDPRELVGAHISEVIARVWLPELEHALAEIARKGHHTFEAVQKRRDGSTFSALVSTTIVRTPQGALRVSNIIDLTERKAAAEAVERARALEIENERVQEASRMKSEFLANMSHELRTPLNSIIGFAEILSSGDVDVRSADHDEFVADILSSGRHLLRLINDILDLSKVEAGKLEFHPEETTFDALAAEVASIVRAVAAAKGVRIVVTSEPLELHVDPARLKQVLYNYVSNAIKFTPSGGVVTVRALAETTSTFRVEVEDTGVGIDAADLSRLFVAFEQIDAGDGLLHGGTGLGLALTKRLVEAQGGTVGVVSERGKGSTFWASLPRFVPARTSLPARRRWGRQGAPRVLVVEDEARDSDVIVGALVTAGFDVETAATGAQAIARAAEVRFDAITLDLLLPDMSGLEVLAEVRRAGESVAARVVVVSVVAEQGAVGGLHVDEFVPKPVKQDLLLAALRRAGVVSTNGARVLVVDDDAVSFRLVQAALAPYGYSVIGRSDGLAGLEAIAAERPHAVILDLLMPGIDGFEFLARLRDRTDLPSVPVVVWTSKDLTPEERDSLRRAALAVVEKGDGARTLLEGLRASLPAFHQGGGL